MIENLTGELRRLADTQTSEKKKTLDKTDVKNSQAN